ncbi:uncharacterized protein EDB93DRAFT_1083071, partial [Suillus bovinus]|uniref:uncharacterized protein n=1 Tax=Suillus bovinus TaxID=48563 RepID=UPI001B866A94
LLSQSGARLDVLSHRELLLMHVKVVIDKAEGMMRQNNSYVPSTLAFYPEHTPRVILSNVCTPYASRHDMTLAV